MLIITNYTENYITFARLNIVKHASSKAYLKALTLCMMVHLQSNGGTLRNEQDGELCDVKQSRH